MAVGLQALMLAMMLSDAARAQDGAWRFPNSRSINVTETENDSTVNATDITGRNSINIHINTPPEGFPFPNPSVSINGFGVNPPPGGFVQPGFPSPPRQPNSFGFGHKPIVNPSNNNFGGSIGGGSIGRPGFNQFPQPTNPNFSGFGSSGGFQPSRGFETRPPFSANPFRPPKTDIGGGGLGDNRFGGVGNNQFGGVGNNQFGGGGNNQFGGFDPLAQRPPPPPFVPPPFGNECSCIAFYLCKAQDVVFAGPGLLDQRSANKDVIAISSANETVDALEEENNATVEVTLPSIDEESTTLDANETLFRVRRADEDSAALNDTDAEADVSGRSGFQPFPPPPFPNTIPGGQPPGRPVTNTPGCPPMQVCCRNSILPPRPAPRPLPPLQPKCGSRNLNGIVGRVKNPNLVEGETQFGEYPWQAAILRKDGKERLYVCGGTLISPVHILTAAHCVHTHLPINLKVRLGEWDVSTTAELYPFVELDAVEIRVHPEFYPGNLNNDVAIIRLAFPVDFTASPHVAPACLPPRFESFAGRRCVVTGWGKDAFGFEGLYQNILKQVDLPVINNFDCENRLRHTRLGPGFFLHPGFLCAGGEPGKDACKGDGGSPLVCEHENNFVVAGIVSWGIGCGHPNVPGVYVRVTEYLDWINQAISLF